MSERAQSALINASGPNPGAKVGWSSPAALTELERAGLITRNHNLSAKGATERSRLIRAREDQAFN